jgi:hypothetical protein
MIDERVSKGLREGHGVRQGVEQELEKRSRRV